MRAQARPRWRRLPQALSSEAGSGNGAQELEAPLSHGFPCPRPRQARSTPGTLTSAAHVACGHCRGSVGAPHPHRGCGLFAFGVKADMGVSKLPKQPFTPFKSPSQLQTPLSRLLLQSGLQGRALPGEKPEQSRVAKALLLQLKHSITFAFILF